MVGNVDICVLLLSYESQGTKAAEAMKCDSLAEKYPVVFPRDHQVRSSSQRFFTYN